MNCIYAQCRKKGYGEKTLYGVNSLNGSEGESGLTPTFAINKLHDTQIFISNSGLDIQLLNSTWLVMIFKLISSLIAP